MATWPKFKAPHVEIAQSGDFMDSLEFETYFVSASGTTKLKCVISFDSLKLE